MMLCEDRRSLFYIFCLLLLKFSLYLGFQDYASLVSLFLCLEFSELLESAELCLSQIWKIFSCFFLNYYFLSFSWFSHWYHNYLCVNIVLQVLEALFISFKFILCSSEWVISVDIFSYSLTFSIIIFIMLLRP